MPNTMRAFRMLNWQEPPALDEIDVPEPGPNEIRIKVAGNGLCQSDLHMPHIPAVMEQLMGWRMPFTLGHEVGGWIDKFGSDFDEDGSGYREGQPVAIEPVAVFAIQWKAAGFARRAHRGLDCRAQVVGE